MTRRTFALVPALALALAACGDNKQSPTDAKVADGKSTTDGKAQTDGGGTAADQGALPASAMQAVVNKLLMPKSGKDYAYDYDGTGKKNKLGDIAGAVAILGGAVDLQGNVDTMMSDGSFLLLLDVLAKSITDDPAAKLQAWQGVDGDNPANAADNFSGSEAFTISSSSPTDLILGGGIASGLITAGPGTLQIPVPVGTTPTMVSVKKAHMEAKLSSTPASAMTDGKIYGAIPWTDVDTKLIPAIAGQLDKLFKDPSTNLVTKALLAGIDAAPKDGTIDANDVREYGLFKAALQPDVDVDGDKTADSMSVGLGFTAVGAKITK